MDLKSGGCRGCVVVAAVVVCLSGSKCWSAKVGEDLHAFG